MKTVLLSLGFLILSLITYSQANFGFNNLFKNNIFNELHTVDALGVHSADTFTIRQTGTKKSWFGLGALKPTYLKGFIDEVSDDRDSMYIRFWSFNADYRPDTELYIDSNNQEETFAFAIPYVNGTFKVPFRVWTTTAVSIPFRVRMRSGSDLESEFLNVGATYARIWGRTKFFEQGQIEPRNMYAGIGGFIAFSQLTLNSENTNGFIAGEDEKDVASISYGINALFSLNTFNFVIAIGVDNTFGRTASHYVDNVINKKARPWLGFGIGFSLIDLTVKSTNDDE